MTDTINRPQHYNKNGIEVIDVIETYTPNSPHLANVLKYVCRHNYKGKPLEDLKKARWYLNRAIDLMEKRQTFEELDPDSKIVNRVAETIGLVVGVGEGKRVGGSTEARDDIQREYYDWSNEFVNHCDWCGRAVKRTDTYIAKYDHESNSMLNLWCSQKCRDEHVETIPNGR